MQASPATPARSTLLAFVIAAVMMLTVVPAVGAADAASTRSPYDLLMQNLLRGSTTTTAASPSIDVAAKLPACEVKDRRTRFGKVREWHKTLLDTNLRLKKTYVPWDLVSVSRAGIAGVGKVRRLMIDDLRAMAEAARKAGKPLGVRSAYRSFATQKAIFEREARRVGRRRALKFVARPGHSEHQLGTTIDFTAAGGGPLDSSFGASPAGRWIARNGWKYGFVLSYPKGKKKATCYGYEPWHWRYVGPERAREIHESGQVPRRFLWQNFESVP